MAVPLGEHNLSVPHDRDRQPTKPFAFTCAAMEASTAGGSNVWGSSGGAPRSDTSKGADQK
ncbi:MAG TPA: hypothetical protein VGE74_27595, partial [Gemmata sp.]